MAKLKLGSITVTVNGYFINNGVPYYQRSIPLDLRKRFGKSTIKLSLRKERGNPAIICHRLYEGHTQLFEAMRGNPNLAPADQKNAAIKLLHIAGLKEGDGNYQVTHSSSGQEETATPAEDILQEYFVDQEFEPSQLTKNAFLALKNELPILLSEAFSVYLENHTKGKNKTFADGQHAHWNKLIAHLGDMPIESVQRKDAKSYRDWRLSCKVTPSTVRRELATIKAIFNSAIREIPLNTKNPFEHLNIQSNGIASSDRIPYTKNEIIRLLNASVEIDDERRRLVILLAVTGARLAEIVGLRKCDFNTEEKAIQICEYGIRTTKNDSSIRTIPLIPIALSAVKKQLKDSPSDFLFPSYASKEKIKADSASATLNKWARKFVPSKSMHCFRHSLRDLLRETECPEAISYAIGGWSQGGSAATNYGLGYPNKIKLKHLAKAYSFLI
jgi:integrase